MKAHKWLEIPNGHNHAVENCTRTTGEHIVFECGRERESSEVKPYNIRKRRCWDCLEFIYNNERRG